MGIAAGAAAIGAVEQAPSMERYFFMEIVCQAKNYNDKNHQLLWHPLRLYAFLFQSKTIFHRNGKKIICFR